MLKIKSNVSSVLLGKGLIEEYNAKVKEVGALADRMSPEGGLYVVLVDRSEVYSPVTNCLRGLMDLEKIYSHRALQSNPEMSEEYAIIAKAIKDIDNVISKRKKLSAKFVNNKRPVKKEEAK